MSQLIQLDDRAKKLEGVFRANMQAMAKMVPRTMGDPSRLLRIAYNNVAYDSKLLETCQTPAGMASVIGGIMEALKLGLTIGGPAQEAWLIPFNVKGTKIATLIIGYQGYRNIIDRSKSVLDMHPRAVFENDVFDVDFGTNRITHRPYWLVGQAESGPLIAVYCIAHLQRGGVQIEVMPVAEVEEHRKRSRAAESGPWVTDPVPMALKTVIRKMSKYLPKTSEMLVRALDLDDRADRGVEQNFDVEGLVFDVPMIGGPASKQVGGTAIDKLKAQLSAGEKKLPGGPPMTDEQKAEMEVGARLDPSEVAEQNAEAEAEKPVLNGASNVLHEQAAKQPAAKMPTATEVLFR